MDDGGTRHTPGLQADEGGRAMSDLTRQLRSYSVCERSTGAFIDTTSLAPPTLYNRL